jgi:hypothetical protein
VSVAQHIISDTTPAAASTAAGDTVAGLGKYDAIQIVANLVGATGGTLDVYMQTSPDGGTTWYDYVHFPQLGAGAAAIRYMVNIPSAGATGITVIGTGSSPALAANTVVGGSWGDRLRALYVAGASTSAGAAITISILGYQAKK